MLPFDERGSGPAVLLLHAGVADRTMWAEHLDPLAAAGFRAIAVDLPGFGEAPVVAGEQAPWADVLRCADDLGLGAVAVVGSSFGGAVALRVAAAAPSRLWALGVVSAPAPGVDPSAELLAAWAAEEEALERGDVEAAVEAVVAAWTLPGASGGLRERVAAMQRRAFALQAAAPEATEAPDPVEERPELLAAVDVPALIVAGEHDMADFRSGAERLAGVLPRATHATIAGAGHLAPLETPEAFFDLLAGFLRGAQPMPSASPTSVK